MSQRSYMWENNNPESFSDPSGFCGTNVTLNGGRTYYSAPCNSSGGVIPTLNMGTGFPGLAKAQMASEWRIFGGVGIVGMSIFGVGEVGAAAEGTDLIVLGLDKYGLKDTAAQLGGRTLLETTDLASDFTAALRNPSTQFTLSLDGLAGDSVEEQLLGAAQNGAGGMGNGFTNWEIWQLCQAGRLGSTNLIQAGHSIANPFAL
jgi:hypothetical protein